MTCTPFDADSFAKKLERQRQLAEEGLKQTIAKYADMTADLMRRNAPVSDEAPHIRDTVRVVVTDGGMMAKVRVGSPETPATPIEQGHMAPDGTHVPGARFIYPAIKVTHKKFRSARTRVLRKAAKGAFK